MNDVSQDALTNLTQALHDALEAKGRLRTFADQRLEFNTEDLRDAGLDELTHALVVEMRRTGRLRELAVAAQLEVPGNVMLQAATTNVLKQLDAAAAVHGYSEPPDPFETCFVRHGRAFIDRESLRFKLRRLHGDEAPALVVTGDPQTGKSYSLRLVVHVALAHSAQVAEVDLRAVVYDPLEFAESILGSMGRSSRLNDLRMTLAPAAQAPGARPARSVVRIAKFLADEIRDSGETWWIVVDGIDGDTPSDTRDLVWGLVKHADMAVNLSMRVVLLDCNELLPYDIDDYVEKEAITPINANNVRPLLTDFFTRVAVHSGRNDQAYVAEKVDEVLDRVSPGPNMLPRLAVAVRQAVAPEP